LQEEISRKNKISSQCTNLDIYRSLSIDKEIQQRMLRICTVEINCHIFPSTLLMLEEIFLGLGANLGITKHNGISNMVHLALWEFKDISYTVLKKGRELQEAKIYSNSSTTQFSPLTLPASLLRFNTWDPKKLSQTKQ